jgi:hypothetical protein
MFHMAARRTILPTPMPLPSTQYTGYIHAGEDFPPTPTAASMDDLLKLMGKINVIENHLATMNQNTWPHHRISTTTPHTTLFNPSIPPPPLRGPNDGAILMNIDFRRPPPPPPHTQPPYSLPPHTHPTAAHTQQHSVGRTPPPPSRTQPPPPHTQPPSTLPPRTQPPPTHTQQLLVRVTHPPPSRTQPPPPHTYQRVTTTSSNRPIVLPPTRQDGQTHTSRNLAIRQPTSMNARESGHYIPPHRRGNNQQTFRQTNTSRIQTDTAERNDPIMTKLKNEVKNADQDTYNTALILVKLCQIRHHQNNWHSLPSKINHNLSEVFKLITPPCPNTTLGLNMDSVKMTTIQHITSTIQEHFCTVDQELQQQLTNRPRNNLTEASALAKRILRKKHRKIGSTTIEDTFELIESITGSNLLNNTISSNQNETRVDTETSPIEQLTDGLTTSTTIISTVTPSSETVNTAYMEDTITAPSTGTPPSELANTSIVHTITAPSAVTPSSESTNTSTIENMETLQSVVNENRGTKRANTFTSPPATPSATTPSATTPTTEDLTRTQPKKLRQDNTLITTIPIHNNHHISSSTSPAPTLHQDSHLVQRLILDSPSKSTCNPLTSMEPVANRRLSQFSFTARNTSSERSLNTSLDLTRTTSSGLAQITIPKIYKTAFKTSWKLNVDPNISNIIISDSNLRLAQDFPADWEIHVFPGMRFCNLATILSNFKPAKTMNNIVVAVGICNLHQNFKITVTPDIHRMTSALSKIKAKRTFALGVSIGKEIETEPSNTLKLINQKLSQHFGTGFIEPLSTSETETKINDSIHYTPETVSKILTNIFSYLNL